MPLSAAFIRRDAIARLRYEARTHRDAARRLLQCARVLHDRPIGQRDPLQELTYKSQAAERRRLARQCDDEIADLRWQSHAERLSARFED